MSFTVEHQSSVDVVVLTFAGRIGPNEIEDAIRAGTTTATQHDCHALLLDFGDSEVMFDISVAYDLVSDLSGLGVLPTHKFAVVCHDDRNLEAYQAFELVFHNRHFHPLRRFLTRDDALLWLTRF